MKHKLFIFLFLLAFVVVGSGEVVSGVECTADLLPEGNGCTISNSLTLNDTYSRYIESNATGNSAIRILASNVIFDCNNSVIYGNWTNGITPNSNYRGVYTFALNNITVKNCNFRNYGEGALAILSTNKSTFENIAINDSYYGVFLSNHMYNNTLLNFNVKNIFNAVIWSGISGRNADRINLSNFYIENNSRQGILLYNFTEPFLNNLSFYNGQIFIDMNTTSNAKISNIYMNSSSSFPLRVTNSYDVVINNAKSYNSFYSSFVLQANKGANLTNSFGKNVTSGWGVEAWKGGTNYNFINNTFNTNSSGYFIFDIENFLIKDSTIFNTTNNYDGYNTGIQIERNVSYGIIENNNILGYGCAGILIRKSNNITVKNNFLNQLSIPESITSNTRCSLEPPTAISILELYKGWTGDGTEIGQDNITKISTFKSTNITIENNTFGNEVQIYLQAQGTENLVQDITNYKYISFQAPPTLVDRTDFYINPSIQNWSNVNISSTYNLIMGQGYVGTLTSGHRYIYYSYNIDYLWFKGNESNSMPLNLYGSSPTLGLQNALIYNTTGQIKGNSNLASNDGNINITLSPNEAVYVLDNLNITEGVSRQNNPFAITQKTSKSAHITNNLTSTVSSLPVYINVGDNCGSIGQFTFTSHSGAVQTITKNQFTCSGNYVQLTLNNVENSMSSNVLEWTYGCSAFEQTGYEIIKIAGALLVLSGVLFFLFKKGLFEEMTVGQIVMLFIVLAVALALYVGSADIIGGTCQT